MWWCWILTRRRSASAWSYKQKLSNPWENIDAKYQVGVKVKGKVVNLVPYGAFVELEPGVEGLVHVTELSWTKRIAKPSDVLKADQEIEAVVSWASIAKSRRFPSASASRKP